MKYLFSSMSDIGMNSDVDIGALLISEWRFSVWHICLRYRNNRCRCRMSDIANIEIDVDAHLWLSVRYHISKRLCCSITWHFPFNYILLPLSFSRTTSICPLLFPFPLLSPLSFPFAFSLTCPFLFSALHRCCEHYFLRYWLDTVRIFFFICN